MLNPLIDAIFMVVSDQHAHKVHTISTTLNISKNLSQLDKDPHKDLFKRNFLIMNALYQLQQELIHEGFYLSVSSMHIQLTELGKSTPQAHDELRSYYLDWTNYETSEQDVIELLDSFWQKFARVKPTILTTEDQIQSICQQWQLSYPYKAFQLKKSWRQHALTHHPDKTDGNGERFKQLKYEYELLKAHLKTLN
ncbi:hypothetical protein PSECIP111951_03747 [Pseudoalteromonas holothuriae]|uniref:DnaJ-related protein N-terminal domain-containing protein n=1 Tax=Pseudoalteromonas holothuriae TaxID=2963714 RepID=A0A9W4W785_9GAMM|nr:MULTISPECIES: DNA-J related domain-containing protein [unclassified Pseudoalteromonas]CAH9065607.1 hypothetical protein PSECIP111854_03718 [Pseudoalteromonas sp. CIP111854]CAH9067274.1 hypothetical protein PSECIP111951_03747 [Pseudoalteromonas sp. CIP111951]